MAKYDPEKARRRYRENKEQYSRLQERAKELGLLEEVERTVEEILHSPNLQVFRYAPRVGKPHLFAALSDGTRHPLCGHPIDELIAAGSVTTTRPGDCDKCNRAALELFKRRSALDSAGSGID
jgi:hypothetical protein